MPPSLTDSDIFPELSPEREELRLTAASQWIQCDNANCLGIEAGQVEGIDPSVTRCLVCLGDAGVGMARSAIASGGRLDLRGCHIRSAWLGQALAPAISREVPIAIAADFAVLEAGAPFTSATFGDDAAFRGATFGDEAGFRRATFGDRAQFGDAQFGNRARFGGARFGKRAWFEHSMFGAATEFSEASFDEEARFGRASFGWRARFRKTTFGDGARFGGAKFGDRASFSDARFGEGARFAGAEFGGHAGFDRAKFAGGAVGTVRFTEAASFCGMRSSGHWQIAWVRVADMQTTPDVNFDDARFGAEVTLQGEGRVSLARLVLGGPSIVIGLDGELKISSLDQTNCEKLTIQDLDMSECLLGGAIRLSKLGLDGRIAFGSTAGFQTRRKRLKGDDGSGSAGLAGHRLEGHYRSLRKALEDSGDHPGASDFYYGQMLQRLRRTRGFERALMELYRAVAGFGVRGWRPLCWLVAVIAIGAVILSQTPSYPTLGEGVIGSLEWAFALLRAPARPSVDLSGLAFATALTLRILGPALVASGLFALRARVRR